MGNHMPKPEPNHKGPGTHPTIVSAVTSAPCLSGHPNKEYLVLAFFAGVILTLLLMAFVFLIIKSCRKSGHSRPQTLDPPSDHLAKLSSSEEVLTYASMTFKAPRENSNHLNKSVQTAVHSDPVVYAQVKVTNSPCLSSEA
nr:transmembrane protein C1orf162 homolog [Odocoileus virginianus texanus]